MPYHHLTKEERYVIFHLTRYGLGPAEIGRRLDRAASTISRELKRHTDPWSGYIYENAQWRAEQRRKQVKRPTKREDPALWKYVSTALANDWSPEGIAGRMKEEYPKDETMRISHEAVYQWVYRDSQEGGNLYQHLRRQHRRRRKLRSRGWGRGQIKDRVSIDDRPAIVGNRRRFGDWESDTVEGAKGCGYLGTHVERKSRYLVASKLRNKKTKTWTRQTIMAFRSLPSALYKTMTVDNGKEFANFKHVQNKLRLSVYFAHPYSAWERGTNENTNGLLRQYFPKGCDFRKVRARKLAKVVQKLNNRPRKCLDYRTPREVLFDLPIVALVS